MLLLAARHLKNSRKDDYVVLKHLVSGQEKAVRDCCMVMRRWKPGKTLNFAQFSTRACWPPPSVPGCRRCGTGSTPQAASRVGIPGRQEPEAKVSPGKPLSAATQMLVLPQEHPISLSPSPQRRLRGSARARSLLETALLGMAGA